MNKMILTLTIIGGLFAGGVMSAEEAGAKPEGKPANEPAAAPTTPRTRITSDELEAPHKIIVAAANSERSNTYPLVVDWDGDGKKDLLVGHMGNMGNMEQTDHGALRVYLNIGEDAAPKLDVEDFKYVKADGELAKTDAG